MKRLVRNSWQATDAELKALQAISRILVSRIKNGRLKRNPVGWFRDVSPVTPEAVKKLYRKLAAKYHPDKGGDTRTMQEINSDYDKAIKIAASNEGNEYRAEAERKAARPLREAIEFAVTLPDDVDVVIRGLWLWLQGSGTWKSRQRIKSFVASDGKRFKWAPKKKAWFFAAVPSKNRKGEMSFDEIDALHGRELVNERKRRLSLNPLHPITAFSGAASGILSTLHIKEMLAKNGLRRKRRATSRKPNPDVKLNEREFNRLLAEIVNGNHSKIRSAKLKGRLAGYSAREVDWLVQRARLASRLKTNATKAKRQKAMRKARTPKRKRNIPGFKDELGIFHPIRSGEGYSSIAAGDTKSAPRRRSDARRNLVAAAKKAKTKAQRRRVVSKFARLEGIKVSEAERKLPKFKPRRKNPQANVPRRRTFEMFQGRPATTARQLPVSKFAPKRLDQLGDLIELKLNSGQVMKFGTKFKLCAAGGKLWIAGGKIAKPNPGSLANGIDAIDRIDHVVYATHKPHHGDHSRTHYIHKLGEESGHRPLLCADREGFPVIRGGRYKIEARGIVN